MNSTTSSSVVYNLGVEANRVTIYVYPITMALTILANTMNIAVLLRRPIRSSSCSRYFLALAIDSLVYMIFTPMNTFLSNRFGIAIGSSPFGCRIQFFFVYSSALFFTSMLVCASIDRFFTSSSSAFLRNLSNLRIAQKVIIVVSISIIIYMSPFFLIYYWNYNTNQCLQYSTTIITIYFSSRVIIYYIIGPLAMITFGLLTINNIRNQTRSVAPLAPQNRRRRTEGQLTRVLIIQVGLHLIFSLPTAVTYIIITFIPSIVTPLVTGFRVISIIWQQVTFFLSFFLYTLSATVFRKELQKMFKWNDQHNGILRRFDLTQRRVLPTNTNDTRV